RNTVNLAPAEAKKRAKLAQALPRLPKTREGLRQGVISGAHAVVIVTTVEHLPDEVVADAEALLAEYAPRLTPTQLMTAGKHIRIQVDPDGAYRDEKEGRKRRSVRIAKDQDGWVHLVADLPPDEGATLEAALHAVSAPRPV